MSCLLLLLLLLLLRLPLNPDHQCHAAGRPANLHSCESPAAPKMT